MAQQSKVIAKRKKFIQVDIPLIKTKVELIGEDIEELKNKTIKFDLTRQLRGKSVEATFRVETQNNQAVAEPIKIVLMPYFIRRMIRKRISYVEDSFTGPTQESLVKIKPFLITRKKVSRAVRKTLRNLTKNWLEDYLAERKNNEIFSDILSNKLQKPLSLKLKKTYPLSLCEIRVLEILRPLQQSEIPKIEKKAIIEKEIRQGLDQFEEIEQEKIKRAEEEIKKTQEKASELEEIEKIPQETPKTIRQAEQEIKQTQEVAEEIEKIEEKQIEKPAKSKKEKSEN